MSNIHMALTLKGQELNAKIQAGNGDIPLEITRIVSASGYSDNPLELEDVIDRKQTAQIIRRTVTGVRAAIEITLSNQGNTTTGESPLTAGYALTQFGMYAIDPDEGEILYRISQFDTPNYVPAATEMGWTINPTWNFTVGNASEVIVHIDPSGMATAGDLNNHIDQDVMSEHGVHGLRYYEGVLQAHDGTEWVNIAVGTPPPTPPPVNGQFFVVDGVLSSNFSFGSIAPNGVANTLWFNPGVVTVTGKTLNLL